MSKEGRYERVYDQIEKLIKNVDNPISRMSTVNALLHYKLDNFFWTGFYLLQNNQLLVGPYQGPLACLTLKKDTGVCWAAINKKASIVVEDVNLFPGHIACDSRSKSEIAVPVYHKDKITGVLDVDSDLTGNFNETDKHYLTKIVGLIYKNTTY